MNNPQFDICLWPVTSHSSEACGICGVDDGGFSPGFVGFIRLDTKQLVCEACTEKHSPVAWHMKRLLDQAQKTIGAFAVDDNAFVSTGRQLPYEDQIESAFEQANRKQSGTRILLMRKEDPGNVGVRLLPDPFARMQAITDQTAELVGAAFNAATVLNAFYAEVDRQGMERMGASDLDTW